MARIRTIFGLQEKANGTIDGFETTWCDNLRCWMDDEGNLYGAAIRNVACGGGINKSVQWYSSDGSIRVTRQNKDYDDVRKRLEEQTGKTLRPVNVSGVFPYVTVEGYGWSPEDKPPKHWYHDEVLRKIGSRSDFGVTPLVIMKKYARKMEVKEVNMEMMEALVKAEPATWSVV